MLDEARTAMVFRRLLDAAPEGPRLHHVKEEDDHFRALVACLLSAQSRDANTAVAKAALFARADTPEGISRLDETEIAAAIRPCGLYNAKARNLKRLAAEMVARGGEVPRDRRGLMALPGIGRKCADIVLRFSFGEDAIAVDTHVHRLCRRLGLAAGKTEAAMAADLDARAPAWARRDGHLALIRHAKRICVARAPKCGRCGLVDLCERNGVGS